MMTNSCKKEFILTWKKIAEILPEDARAFVNRMEATGNMPRYLIDLEKEKIFTLTPVFSNTNHDPNVTSPMLEVLSAEVKDALHNEGYISCHEAAEILGVRFGQLIAYHRAGVLMYSTVQGVRMAFRRSDVEAMKVFLDKTHGTNA